MTVVARRSPSSSSMWMRRNAGKSSQAASSSSHVVRVSNKAATAVPSKFSKLSPCGGRTLVRAPPEEDSQRTLGGVLLPSSGSAASEGKPKHGLVVEVHGLSEDDNKAGGKWEAGSVVCYASFAGTTLKLNDDEYVLLKNDDVMGVLPQCGGSDDEVRKAGEAMRNISLFGRRILVKVEESSDESSGGVLLPEAAQDKPLLGTVMAIGSGCACEDGSSLEARMTVMYPNYSGTEFEEDGDTYIVLRADDVLASLS